MQCMISRLTYALRSGRASDLRARRSQPPLLESRRTQVRASQAAQAPHNTSVFITTLHAITPHDDVVRQRGLKLSLRLCGVCVRSTAKKQNETKLLLLLFYLEVSIGRIKEAWSLMSNTAQRGGKGYCSRTQQVREVKAAAKAAAKRLRQKRGARRVKRAAHKAFGGPHNPAPMNGRAGGKSTKSKKKKEGGPKGGARAEVAATPRDRQRARIEAPRGGEEFGGDERERARKQGSERGVG